MAQRSTESNDSSNSCKTKAIRNLFPTIQYTHQFNQSSFKSSFIHLLSSLTRDRSSQSPMGSLGSKEEEKGIEIIENNFQQWEVHPQTILPATMIFAIALAALGCLFKYCQWQHKIQSRDVTQGANFPIQWTFP